MKLFVVHPENVDWDEYESCVILAESKETVEKMFELDCYGDKCFVGKAFFDYDRQFPPYFSKSQGKIFIEEIDMNEEGLVSSSFKAG